MAEIAVQQFRLCFPWYKVVPINSRIISMDVDRSGRDWSECRRLPANKSISDVPKEKLGGKYGKLCLGSQARITFAATLISDFWSA